MNCDEMSDHYLELAEQMFVAVAEGKGDELVAQVDDELPQIRLIFDWFESQHNAPCGLRLAYLMQAVWQNPTHSAEGVTWLQTFLSMQDTAVHPNLQTQCELLITELQAQT